MKHIFSSIEKTFPLAVILIISKKIIFSMLFFQRGSHETQISRIKASKTCSTKLRTWLIILTKCNEMGMVEKCQVIFMWWWGTGICSRIFELSISYIILRCNNECYSNTWLEAKNSIRNLIRQVLDFAKPLLRHYEAKIVPNLFKCCILSLMTGQASNFLCFAIEIYNFNIGLLGGSTGKLTWTGGWEPLD